MNDNPITMAQAYDALDAMAKAGKPLDGPARDRFLEDARAGRLHFAPPTDEQRRRFASHPNRHGNDWPERAAAEITRQVRHG